MMKVHSVAFAMVQVSYLSIHQQKFHTARQKAIENKLHYMQANYNYGCRGVEARKKKMQLMDKIELTLTSGPPAILHSHLLKFTNLL